MRYYISDLHFFHNRLNDLMDCRGFPNLEEMHSYMIGQWNSRVHRNDEVVVLGDFSLGKTAETLEILDQLKGRIYLLRGNHDRWLNNSTADFSRLKWVKDLAEMKDNGRKIIACHYPLMCYPGQFRCDATGQPTTWMLHGHIHNTADVAGVEAYKDFVRSYPRQSRKNDQPIPAPCQMINCFCMYSDYVPLTLDEWIHLEKSGELKKKFLDQIVKGVNIHE